MNAESGWLALLQLFVEDPPARGELETERETGRRPVADVWTDAAGTVHLRVAARYGSTAPSGMALAPALLPRAAVERAVTCKRHVTAENSRKRPKFDASRAPYALYATRMPCTGLESVAAYSLASRRNRVWGGSAPEHDPHSERGCHGASQPLTRSHGTPQHCVARCSSRPSRASAWAGRLRPAGAVPAERSGRARADRQRGADRQHPRAASRADAAADAGARDGAVYPGRHPD